MVIWYYHVSPLKAVKHASCKQLYCEHSEVSIPLAYILQPVNGAQFRFERRVPSGLGAE